MISTLVIGGGIGGLSVARELALRGLAVTVLEKARALNPVGAGIIMNPNAMAVLERNGLAAALREGAWPYLVRETYDARGRLLAVRDYRPLYESGKLAKGALVHRAHLLDVLYGGVPRAAVHFGAAAKRVALEAGGVRVETEDGRTFEADVLVGADGIHSVLRRELFGEAAPRYMGYRSHRMVVDNGLGVRHFSEFLGRGQRIGLVPVSESRLYVWTTFNSPQGRPPAFSGVAEFQRLFAQFADPRVRRALAAPRALDEIITTEIEELALERWSRGRAVLLGDAVHALTPNIGQGAGMAMEDAAVLAEELQGVARGTQALERAFERYEARRRPRVASVMSISRQVGEDGQRSGRLACWLRNRRVRRAARDAGKAAAELERLLAYTL
jgi:2-polyprenyl-6-methoxyphenol hydroxylase-like FAD-dependent oxidoreductase